MICSFAIVFEMVDRKLLSGWYHGIIYSQVISVQIFGLIR